MRIEFDGPAIYLITRGTATAKNFDEAKRQILDTIKAAVEEKVQLIQIREKQLSAKLLFELSSESARITRGTMTRLFVNDRSDIAEAANADGVHLASDSLKAQVVRRAFPRLIVGVSIHETDDMSEVKRSGADFAVLGSVFTTPEKTEPLGLEKFREQCRSAAGSSIIGIGGIDETNFQSVLDAGAAGFAAIRALNDLDKLRTIARSIK